MFRKIEIWILYLVLVMVFISYIALGALVRREALGGGKYIPLISEISKVAYFLAEIPKNLKYSRSIDVRSPWETQSRFSSEFGFVGDSLKNQTYLLLTRYSGSLKESVVELVDLKNFKIIHTWNPNIKKILKNVNIQKNREWKNLQIDHSDFRSLIFHPLLLPDGSIIFHLNDSPLIKIDVNSNLLWIKEDDRYHHSLEFDFDQNIWSCVTLYPYLIDEKYSGSDFGNYFDEGIRKVNQNGEIIFQKSVAEILVQNKLENFLVSNGINYETKPIHLNDVQPVMEDTQYWKRGDVFISIRNLSMVLLYRPSTNKILWKGFGDFFYQHDVDIIDDKHISIFNNNYKRFKSSKGVDGFNEIILYNFEAEKYTTKLRNSLAFEEVKTYTGGCHKVLKNGDLFVQENDYGRLIYFNSQGNKVWSFINRDENNSKLYKVGWCRIIDDNKEIENIKKFIVPKNNEIIYNE